MRGFTVATNTTLCSVLITHFTKKAEELSMDMTHMNHMQMEHEAGTSYLWLIVGVIVLLFSIAAYIWASRTQGKILGHMKKKERADIQKKVDPFGWLHM